MKILVILFYSLICLASCSSDPQFDVSDLQGTWVNEEDSDWIYSFSENELINSYGEEELDKCTFVFSQESCDTKYTTIESTFIDLACEEKWCYEIMTLSDTILSYRESSIGKLFVFKRLN